MKRLVFAVAAIVIFTALLFVSGCVKDDPDVPPQSNIPFDDDLVLTIAQLKIILADSGDGYVFTGNYSFYATVGMDESSGNIYKSVFVQDNDNGVQLNLFNPGGLYLGDSVRILLTGTTLETYGGLLQVNNLDVGNNVLKVATQKYVTPQVVTIEDLTTNIDAYESMVIQLNDVQFMEHEFGETFADSVNKIDENRTLQDCDARTIIVRTSGYANFANKPIPEGGGQLIAIAGRYNTDEQLTLRSYEEVKLDGERCDPGGGEIPEVNISIPELKALYQGVRLQITDDWVIGAHVVANDKSGNYYKTVVIQDDDGGIELKINEYDLYNLFPEGQEIYVKCKNLYLDTYGDVIQLGSVYEEDGNFLFGGIQASDIFTYIVNGPNIEPVTPEVISVAQVDESKIGMLIQLDEVQFITEHLGNTWADAIGQNSKNWNLQNCVDERIIVRTSGYADFAGDELPEGNGEFVGVVSAYNGDIQLYVRKLDDVTLTGERCEIGSGTEIIYSENFDADWGNWEPISKVGSQVWDRDNTNGPDGSACARINGFEAGYNVNDDWLVSPEIDLSTYNIAFFFFESAKNYDGNVMEVFITSNYTGDPATTSWTALTAELSTGGFNWTGSESVNISGYTGSPVRLAFNYTSTNSSAAEWRVDNIEVKAE